MLQRLHISNYALIDQLDITFSDGLTMLTGETGAGKSILLGALSLIMGERVDSKTVRDSSRKLVVEATFDIAGFSLGDFFAEADIDYIEHECILRREVAPGGRSRAFVNDTPVPVTTLRELTTMLIDIHSQHSNMALSQPRFQLNILDSMAGDAALLQRYGEQFAALTALRQELADLQEQFQKARAEEDYIRFQVQQLRELQLQPDEDITLEQLHKRLSNATELKTLMWESEQSLDGGEHGAIEQIKGVAHKIGQAEENLTELQGLGERLQSVLIELKDMSRTIAAVGDNLTCDPAELERVEQRLDEIDALKRKHSVKDVADLLALQHYYEEKLATIEHNDERLSQLSASIAEQEKQAMATARELSNKRRKAAESFAAQLKDLSRELGLKNIAFEVQFTHIPLASTGIDAIQFMVAFNKNQALMPIKDTASGGELSRLMLCVKAIIASHMQLPTIIFDEVDTGVSGDTASMMGRMMRNIARNIQVIAITHLPQVVAHGQHHFVVYKSDTAQATHTSVKALDAEQHLMEIARLLSGTNINQAAIDNARALIEAAQSIA